MSADQASEQRRVFDLAEVVAEVVSSLAPSLKTMGHRIEQAIPPGIVMDSLPGPLGQVFINLINNAYHHAFEDRSDGVLELAATQQLESSVKKGRWLSFAHSSCNVITYFIETVFRTIFVHLNIFITQFALF